MPHSKQAKKRLRQDEKKRMVNRGIKSEVRTVVKKVLKAVDDHDAETANKILPVAMKKIDKAAKRHVLHKNTASRKISKLSKRVQSLSSEPPKEGE
jgi:small subunit ribosomal protein S20